MTEVMEVKHNIYGSLSALTRNDLSKFFNNVNGGQANLSTNVVDKKTDEIYYIENKKFNYFYYGY